MTQEMHLILPFAMYSGGAKHILNVDNKRKFIKEDRQKKKPSFLFVY